MNADNRRIIAQLAEIGREYFETLDVAPGTYTAAEMAQNYRAGDKLKRAIYIFPDRDAKPTDEAEELADLYAWEPLTFGSGSFVCEIPRAMVFYYLWKFEQLDKVPQKDKTRYTRDKEGGLSFYVTISKEAAQLTKFVGYDEFRPNMMQIYLDMERRALVATDTHILAEYPAEIEDAESIDETAPAIYIDPKHIKNLTGRTRVQLVEDGEAPEGAPKHYTAVFTNESGEVYKNELKNGRFPDYRRVYNKVTPGGYLQFTPDAVKEFTKFARQIAKLEEPIIEVSAEEGETCAHVVYTDEFESKREITLALAYPSPLSLSFGLCACHCVNAFVAWNGGLWFNDPSRSIILDSAAARVIVIMPGYKDASRGYQGYARGEFYDALERAEHLPEGIIAPEAKTAPKRRKIAVPVIVDAMPETIEEEKPADAEIIAFAEWLADAVDAVAKSIYRAELDDAIIRVRELARLAGVNLSDILTEAIQAHGDGETPQATAPEPEAFEVPEESEPVDAVIVETRPDPVAVILVAAGTPAPPGAVGYPLPVVSWRIRPDGIVRIRGDTAECPANHQ